MRTSSQSRLALAALLLLAIGCASGAAKLGPGTQRQEPSGASLPDPLDADGQARLKAILDKSRLDELRWPNFSDYATHTKEFYEKDGYALAWTRGGRPTQQAMGLIVILEKADRKGLDNKDYDGGKWTDRVNALNGAATKDENALVDFDVALTVSGMRYASDLHLGKLDPGTLHTDFEPERNEYDLCDFLLKRVEGSADLNADFAKIEPPYQGYQRIMAALERFEQMEEVEKPSSLPTVAKPIAPGQPYADVPQLVERLKFVGDLPATATVAADPKIYAGDAVDGVRRFQARHGLDAQGKLGAQTITAMNVPTSARVLQLKLALERWRWLPHNFDTPPIVVNIPEFLLRGYDENRQVTVKMPVVVGRALRTETPVMEQDMKYLIFWPYWNVPPSILRNEIVPKITKDRAYVQKNQFEVTTYGGDVVTDGVISDDVLSQLKGGKLTVRQKPGPKNALGLIKFIFPNNNNVYLHSTPSQAAFSEARRDFSHGCVRVEDPAALAAYVLRYNPGWGRDKVDAAFKAEKQEQVNLARQIPVLIVYGTAIAPEDGQVHFFEDIYGHDRRLANLFAHAYDSRN